MTLINMKELLRQTEAAGVGCGAFNAGNMEMVIGIIKAAEELNVPVILQVAEGRLSYSPLHLIGPMMLAAARQAKVDVAVHLDHGRTEKTILQALEMGFTSVMYDGSDVSLEENIENTRRVVALAKQYGADAEGEIGIVGGSEGGERAQKLQYTDPLEAELFSRQTGVDAMAIAIGNAHGLYSEKPKQQFDLLAEIHKKATVPLVLHGGSGIADHDFQKAIRNGIRKVNIATSNFSRAVDSVQRYIRSEGASYFGMSDALVKGIYENVKHHIQIFTFCK